jgi:hypothetical protein
MGTVCEGCAGETSQLVSPPCVKPSPCRTCSMPPPKTPGGDLWALDLSTFAVSALIYGAELTPRPELVDRRGIGAHASCRR